MQLFLLILGVFSTTLGIVLYHKSLTLLLLCALLVLFGTLEVNSYNDEYKLILILEVMLMAFEMVKNEDTHSQEMDMEDKTQRIMFLTLGVMMVLAAAFLYLLCH